MLINLSNHPSNSWSDKHLNAAKRKYGKVVDLPFPLISPKANTKQVKEKAEKYLSKIIDLLKSSNDKNNAVHLMGEFTFVLLLAQLLKKRRIKLAFSTTDRIVEEKEGKKIVTFDFVKFREL
jgi:hypothetical protein